MVNVDAIPGEADSGMLNEDLTDLLVAVGQAAADDRRGVLLAIDEVQYLSADELGALITAIHRTTQMNLPASLPAPGSRSCQGSPATPSRTPSGCSSSPGSVRSPTTMRPRRS